MRTRSTVRMPFLKMRLSKFVARSSLSHPDSFAAIDGTRVTPQCFDLCRWRRRDDPPSRIGLSIGMFQADDPPDLAGAGHHERMRRPGPGRHLGVGEEVLHLDTKPPGEPVPRAPAADHELAVFRGRRIEGTGP